MEPDYSKGLHQLSEVQPAEQPRELVTVEFPIAKDAHSLGIGSETLVADHGHTDLLAASGWDDWGLNGVMTREESCALGVALDALGVDDAALGRAESHRDRCERRLELLALLRKVDERRLPAEMLAFQVVQGGREYTRARCWFTRRTRVLRQKIERRLDPAWETPWRENSCLPQCSADELAAAVEAVGAFEEALPVSEWLPENPGLARPGLCTWWVDWDGAAQLSRGLGQGLTTTTPDLIYLGQAGATGWPLRRSSTRTLATRIVEMDLNGRVLSSDLRCTLAALLLDELELTVLRPSHDDSGIRGCSERLDEAALARCGSPRR